MESFIFDELLRSNFFGEGHIGLPDYQRFWECQRLKKYTVAKLETLARFGILAYFAKVKLPDIFITLSSR